MPRYSKEEQAAAMTTIQARAEHFKAAGGTREEYLASAAEAVRAVARKHAWTHTEVRELQTHLAVAHCGVEEGAMTRTRFVTWFEFWCAVVGLLGALVGLVGVLVWRFT